MHIFILTSSFHKEKELSRYFKDIGLKTTHIKNRTDELFTGFKSLAPATDYLLVYEQTTLLNSKTGVPADRNTFEAATHTSTLTLEIFKDGLNTVKTYTASIEGFVFPNLKTPRSQTNEVYAWDEVFVSGRTMRSYQSMKDGGIKNSARDLAFSHMIEDLSHIFRFNEKINLNFHPTTAEEVISFEPFLYELFQNNEYYRIAYQNEVFRPLLNHVLNDGIFVRRASNRKQKNYWLPGLNAGVPLTPKKDALHEITFMFHDLMHFLYPDLVVVDNSKTSKHKYLLARLMSEAFTLVLADMLFISLLKDGGVEYDYRKRKIYPIFERQKFDITAANLPKIKELLWASVSFAVLGQEELFKQRAPKEELAEQAQDFQEYKEKYQRFFQEDYRWTANNYQNMSARQELNKNWLQYINTELGTTSPLLTANSNPHYAPEFSAQESLEQQAYRIFEVMFARFEDIVLDNKPYNPSEAFTMAVKRYMAGQIYIFYKYETLYNELFLSQLTSVLKKSVLNQKDLEELQSIYSIYIDKLTEDNFISSYEAQNYKNIYPIFEPFYVFYDKEEKTQTFKETLNEVFGNK